MVNVSLQVFFLFKSQEISSNVMENKFTNLSTMVYMLDALRLDETE
jgi:hypothetical protein